MLSLDATQGDAPTGLMVLGTRTAFPTIPGECLCDGLDGQRCERCSLLRAQMAPYHHGLRKVSLALKRRWPAFQYASLLEFTTGYGERSGGLRRPHWNLLTKGIPVDQLDAAGAIAFPIWCRHVDAEVQAQDVRPIYAAGGLMGYLALHFQKESQQPPEGFTGQRFNCSRDYFTGCSRATARARAKEAQTLKRETWRQIRRDDVDAPSNVHDIELNAQLAYRVAIATRWVLASASGARLSDQVLPTTTARERGARHAVQVLAARAAALDPDWLPPRDLVLFTAHDA